MSIAIRVLVGIIAAAAGLLLASKLGGLERRARTDVGRARSLPRSFDYPAGGAARSSAAGSAPAEAGAGDGPNGGGWVPMPVAAPGSPRSP